MPAGLTSSPAPFTITVNGEEHQLTVGAEATLLDVLRENLGLTGSKRACGRGECGACTVLLDDRPVMSCVMLAVLVKGAVETVEGLAEESLVVREAFAEQGAFQCGFCTPGQVVRAVSLLRSGIPGETEELSHAMSGNICRCTGYVPIVEAISTVAARGTTD